MDSGGSDQGKEAARFLAQALVTSPDLTETGVPGRPAMRPNEPKVILAKKLYQDKSISLDDICATLKMSRSTLYRYVAMKSDET